MIVKTITQSVTLPASLKEAYSALLSSKDHSAFTGSKAVIDPKPGGTFSIFSGGLHGFTLSLIPGKRIVQAWRCDMKGWPKDYYSIVDFSFSKKGRSTLLSFTHYGVPAACFVSIQKGWKDYYWEPMKKFFNARKV